MPRKRKQPKRGPRKLTAAQRRIFEAGRQAGLAAAKRKRHRQAVEAGKKSGEARRKKKPKKRVAVSVDALTFYDDDSVGVAILSGNPLDTFMADAEWVASVEMRGRDGDILTQEDVVATAQPMWEVENVGRTIRRQVRAWYDTMRGEHPDWFSDGDSPVTDLFKLVLRLT